MSALRWAFQALLSTFAVIVTVRAAAQGNKPSAATEQLLQAIDSALSEQDARVLVEPYLENLKSLDPLAMEKIVMRQWWGLAGDVVAKSHTQQIDFSFSVRKAVKALKDEADELLRTLNPKYGQAQQVTPAFQWAQNDTCIFLTIKYTVRWNAPGALEATGIDITMDGSGFNFTGFGKHSNNKYRYSLSLHLFDNILESASVWSAASVGKLSVTMRKRWGRKWPRLLADKKLKIGNMHVWSDRQESLDDHMKGMNAVANSPVTCGSTEKLYCLGTDTCKKSANCSQCPGKPTPVVEVGLCVGVPTEKATLTFKDADFDLGDIGGDIKIFKARNEFDIDNYVVYWGKSETSKLEGADGQPMEVGRVAPSGGDTKVTLPHNSQIPEAATHLLVFSMNAYGEYGSAGHTIITDAVLPKAKPLSIAFEDDDGDPSHISGSLIVEGPEGTTLIEEFAVHWGKSPAKKINKDSFFKTVTMSIKTPKKNDAGEAVSFTSTHYISKGTKIPDGATHLIAFSKNSHGEHPSGVSMKLVDKVRPCVNKTDTNCPTEISLAFNPAEGDAKASNMKVTMKRAAAEDGVEAYAMYWGRGDCKAHAGKKSGGQAGTKNGHLKDVDLTPEQLASTSREDLEFSTPVDTTTIPTGSTHVLVFTKSRVGESNFCASASMEEFWKLATGTEKSEL